MGQNSENQAWLSVLRHTTLQSIPMAIEAALELNVFDILASKNEPLSAQEIISNFKSPTKNPNAHILLERVLHLLTLPALNSAQPLLKSITTESREKQTKYSLLPPAKFFIKDDQGICFASWIVDRLKRNAEAYKHLPSVILEGGDGFSRVSAEKISHHVAHETSKTHSITLMAYLSELFMSQFLEAYHGFSGINVLVDVGGSTGSALTHILNKYPNMKGINFDQPHLVSSAISHPRMEHVGGDMLESVPSADVAFLKLIIHDWEDDQCVKILTNCKQAVNPQHGKVIIVETNVEDSAVDPVLGNQFSVLFISSHGSKCRTLEDYKRLGKAAGFSNLNVACMVNEFIVLEFLQ